jgi:hypothetical protein
MQSFTGFVRDSELLETPLFFFFSEGWRAEANSEPNNKGTTWHWSLRRNALDKEYEIKLDWDVIAILLRGMGGYFTQNTSEIELGVIAEAIFDSYEQKSQCCCQIERWWVQSHVMKVLSSICSAQPANTVNMPLRSS